MRFSLSSSAKIAAMANSKIVTTAQLLLLLPTQIYVFLLTYKATTSTYSYILFYITEMMNLLFWVPCFSTVVIVVISDLATAIVVVMHTA